MRRNQQGDGQVQRELGPSHIGAARVLALCLLTAPLMADPADREAAPSAPPPPPAAPVFETTGCRFVGNRTVTLRPGEGATAIVYTLDGSSPTPASPRYHGPIVLARTVTVRARSLRDGTPPALSAEAVRRFVQLDVTPVTRTKVNFQPAGAPKPWAYLIDTGSLFARREGGIAFGWSADNRAAACERGRHANPIRDTLIQFADDMVWEIAVVNGTYELLACVGDAAQDIQRQAMLAEGRALCDGLALKAGHFKFVRGIVTVEDGLLTLRSRNAPVGPARGRICWIEIKPAER